MPWQREQWQVRVYTSPGAQHRMQKKKDPPIRFLLHGRNVKNRETFTGATLLLVTGGIETLLSTCAWNMAWIFSRCFWAQKHNHHW